MQNEETKSVGPEFTVATMRFRNAAEYATLLRVRLEAFSPWYADRTAHRFTLPARLRLNALAEALPEFFHEVRTSGGAVAGWHFCIPTNWDGRPETLGTFDERFKRHRIGRAAGWGLTLIYLATRLLPFLRPLARPITARIRRSILAQKNTIMMSAMLVCPEFRGRALPALLIQAIIQRGRAGGFSHAISALRPSHYGVKKLAHRTGYDPRGFEGYCLATRHDARPLDPFLRTVTRCGALLLRVEPRNYTRTRTLAEFEKLRRTWKPDLWYEAAPGQWECGETQTWFMNNDGTVTSVEPEIWCELPLD